MLSAVNRETTKIISTIEQLQPPTSFQTIFNKAIPLDTSPLNKPSYTVLGFGTPCVDLVFQVQDLFLQTFTLEKSSWRQVEWNNFSLLLNKAKDDAYDPVLRMTGGSCSNTIKTLANLNNSTAFFGKLGTDSESEFFRSMTERLKIHLIEQPSEDPITQIAVLVTPDHERTMRAYPSLSLNLSPDLLSTDLFNGVKLAHFEGYMLKEFSLEFIQRAMQLSRESGVTVSFDLGCDFIASSYRQNILELLNNIDILFSNESEAIALFGSEYINISSNCGPITVICQGARGALICSKEEQFSSPPIEARVRDTTGAGDAFAAGFLHGYQKGYSLKECAWIGNLLGGTIVTYSGAEIPEKQWPSLRMQIEENLSKKKNCFI